VHLVESARNLTDLVGGEHVDGFNVERDGLAVTLAHAAHRLRQPQPGNLQRTCPQPTQRPDHGPRHNEGDEQNEEHNEEHFNRGVHDRLRRLVVQHRSA
jgi:hypothetical protein